MSLEWKAWGSLNMEAVHGWVWIFSGIAQSQEYTTKTTNNG